MSNLVSTLLKNIQSTGFSRGRSKVVRLRPLLHTQFEPLEVRITPATAVWTGAGTDSLWSDAANWVGNVAPVIGDSIDFPIGVTNLSSVNDYPSQTSFNSIQIDAAGYILTSASSSNTLILPGGIKATFASGNATYAINTLIGDNVSVDVAGGTLSVDNGSPIFIGSLPGSGLTKSGAGILDLVADGNYTGPTTVSSGTLLVEGDLSASSQIAVNSGAQLSGTGIVPGIVSTGGTVNPAFDGVPLILSGSRLSLDENSQFGALIKGNTPGTGSNHYSQVVLTGAVVLNNPVLNPTIGGGFTPTPGDTIDLIKGATSVTGTFNNQPEGSDVTIGANHFKITYQGGVGGHDVVLTYPSPSTTTTVTALPNPSAFGQSVEVDVAIHPVNPTTDAPSGMVQFLDGTTVVATAVLTPRFPPTAGTTPFSTAEFATSALSVGLHHLKVVYLGDTEFTGSSASVDQTVNQGSSTLTVTVPQTTITFGQTVPITGRVSVNAPGGGIATGTLTFADGQTVLAVVPLVDGSASFTPTNLLAGDHSIAVTYSGDNNVTSSVASLPLVVVQASTYILLTSSNPTAVFGQPITYSASVYPFFPPNITPQGTLSFYDGTTLLGKNTLVGGQTSLTLYATGVGQAHNILAVFTPSDGNTGPSFSAVLAETVNKADTSLLFYYQRTRHGVGLPTTVIAALPGSGIPTGTFTFYVNGRALKPKVIHDGMSGLFLPRSIARGKTVSLVYKGDGNFNPSASNSVTITPRIINGSPHPVQVFRIQAAKVTRARRVR